MKKISNISPDSKKTPNYGNPAEKIDDTNITVQLANTKSEPVIISDTASNISSTPSIEMNNESEPDSDHQLLSDLAVSDSDEDIETKVPPVKIDNSSDQSPSDQESTSDSIDSVSKTMSITKPTPYEVEPTQPIPSYVPTPKNRENVGRRAVKYIPVSEWMFDQLRIICKANQNVGEAMKNAMIQEGLLHVRK